MSSTRPSRAFAAALLALGVTVTALSGCSGDDEPGKTAASSPAEDVAGAVRNALHARAAAVRRADPDAFARSLGGGRAFRQEQLTWYANLAQLPISQFRYRFDPASLVRDADGYWVTVEEVLQLDGYDAAPVVSPDRFRLVAARPGGRLRVASTTDPSWEAAHEVRPQPWELGPLEVRASAGVLGVFDADSVAGAARLLTSVESGIADVSAYVPYEWSRAVVVYALSDPRFLESLEDVPGDDPGDLDAVSFPVGQSTRFVLNPRVVDRGGAARDRLVRHELTHVAVGTRDDAVPVWLSEGLAEWVSVRPLPPEGRRLPDAALAAARAGNGDLPDDESFNDQDSQAHYGLAWWTVEYLADSYGEEAPWLLLDALDVPGADPDAVLRDQFGTTTSELAAQADTLLLATYAPAEVTASPTASPTATPTDESPSPSQSE